MAILLTENEKTVEYLRFGVWHVGGSSFKEYAIKNNMVERIGVLKSGLDDESISVINLMIKRYMSVPDKRGAAYYINKEDLNKCSFRQASEDEEQMRVEKAYKECDDVLVLNHRIDMFLWYYEHGMKFFPQKVREYVVGRDFFDLGAYFGDSAYLLSKFKPGIIHSFEISMKHKQTYYDIMQKAAIENFVLNQIALSNKDDIFYFNDSGSEGNNIFAGGQTEVRMMPLDSYIKGFPNCTPGLFKTDIEGEETNFLLGAKETIFKYRPVMILSMYHNPQQFFEMKPLIESWNLNYAFKVRRLSVRSLVSETALLVYPAELA